MTTLDALRAVQDAGAELRLEGGNVAIYGELGDDVLGVLRDQRDRVRAVLRIREIHRVLGLSEADIQMAEQALLSGDVGQIIIREARDLQ